MASAMTIERRDDNVVFVRFSARPPGGSCEDCPFRRCCTCAHWCRASQTCRAGREPAACGPATAPDDWCGVWERRPLEVVGTSS